jgi:ParB family chromosome partitioning protein
MTANPNVHFVTVDQLTLSPHNVRQDVSETYIDELAASISEIGLIQSLAGIKTDAGIEIIAGGCRLRALKKLAEQSGNAEFVEVPVIIAPDVETAQLWSAAENEARRTLRPGSILRMARNLTAKGHKLNEISKIIATPVAEVRKLMALAALPDAVIDALDSDQIDFEQAKALTIAPDQESLQMALQKALDGESSFGLRRLFTSELTSRSQIVKFVGIDDIKAAGISTREDMFDNVVYVDTPEKVHALFDAKIQATLDSFEADGWKWAKFDDEAHSHYDVRNSFTVANPDIDPLSADERAELTALEDDESWQMGDDDRQRMEDLRDIVKIRGWSTEAKAISGVVLFFSYSGEIEIVRGAIAKEQAKEAAEQGLIQPKDAEDSEAAKKTDSGPFSAKLTEDLQLARLLAVRTAILDKPTLALSLLAYDLSAESGGYSALLDRDFTHNTQLPGVVDGIQIDPRLEHGSGFPNIPDDNGAAFEAFADAGKKAINDNIALSTAKALSLYRTRDMMAVLEARAGCHMRDVWTPTVANFLGRVKVDYLDDLFTELTGMQADEYSVYADLKKKGPKADYIASIFAHDEAVVAELNLTTDQWAMIDTWTPMLD